MRHNPRMTNFWPIFALLLGVIAPAAAAADVRWQQMVSTVTSASLAGGGKARLVAATQASDGLGQLVLTTIWYDEPVHYRCFDILSSDLLPISSRCDGPSRIDGPTGEGRKPR